jgi:hypothetical protein
VLASALEQERGCSAFNGHGFKTGRGFVFVAVCIRQRIETLVNLSGSRIAPFSCLQRLATSNS